MSTILVRIGTPVTKPLSLKDDVTGANVSATFANTRVDMSVTGIVSAEVSSNNASITFTGLTNGSITIHVFTDATYTDSSGVSVTESKDVLSGVDVSNSANSVSLVI